jgi:hypothetical protein
VAESRAVATTSSNTNGSDGAEGVGAVKEGLLAPPKFGTSADLKVSRC